MLSIETITLSIVAVLNAMIVWLVASQGWRSLANRYFACVAFFSVCWIAGTAMFFGAATPAFARLALLLFYIGPMFMLLSLCYFATVFHSKRSALTIPNVIFTALTIIMAGLILSDQNILTAGITITGIANNELHVDSLWYLVYSLYFSIGFLIVFSEFLGNLHRNTGSRKQQLVYISSAMAVVILLSTVSNITLPVLGNTNLIWIGPLCTFFAVIIITLAIVRHALFDIKLAAVRSAAYVLTLVTLAASYYLLAYVVSLTLFKTQANTSVSVNPVNILLALVLAFMFQPIKGFFDKTTNDIFYRQSYKSEDFFASLSDLLTSTTNLRGLVERASDELTTTFKAEQAFFFLYYTNETDHHMSAGTHGYTRLPLHDARMLDYHVATTTDNKIVATELLPDESKVRRMLLSHRIALVMPLRQGETLAGYVMLGERRSGTYTKRDLNVLLAIRNELVIAIQNALSIHEVKELNATLQQRIDVATKELRSSNAQLKHIDEIKDEFMSMASHQLRTPLTSIKGYLSMVLEGDMGSVTPQQHKMLQEAFNSSERMVRLIADFLNVSRLQTGKFLIEKAPFDIKKIVKEEVANLEVMAGGHDIKLRVNVTKAPLQLVADEAKIRQVVMNFVDNAIYYSRPHSTIVINLERVKDAMALTVVDTGIGVPADEQAKLFTKFFRAHNARKARPDGTGVGLYLARRVVSGHGGSIIFSSTEGKGSTFGFRLPLSEPLTPKPITKPVEKPTKVTAKPGR